MKLQDKDNIINIIVIIFFLFLPYFIFKGNFHIGGDDSHLFYIYPQLWIENVSNSTWTSYSSLGLFSNQYYYNPLLYILSFLHIFFISSYVIQNIIFSTIFIGGFVFLKNFLYVIIPQSRRYIVEINLSGFVYIFSPILLITPLRAYLANIWLIPLIPLLAFLFSKYYKTNHFKYNTLIGIVSFFFALAFNAVPWLLGVILPLISGVLIGVFFLKKARAYNLLKKFFLSGLLIGLTQLFWLFPFFMSVMSSHNSVGSKVFNDEFENTFIKEVLATSANTTILDPLRNFFHIGLQENFKWSTLQLYSNWYLKIDFLNYIFPIIIFLGIILSYKNLKRVYLVFLFPFIVSLFLFTVKIGLLKDFFMILGNIPGFVMFRNFYDKFSIGYVFFFSIIICFSLIFLKNSLNRSGIYKLILIVIAFVVLYDSKPLIFGDVFNDNIRGTNSVGQNIIIPQEYLNFMDHVSKVVPHSSNIFDVPFGNSAFTIIVGESGHSVFSGKSPVKLFSGINDFSGKLSFDKETSKIIYKFIRERKYYKLRNLLSIYNINYVFETNNIPFEILNSHLYSEKILKKQDEIFRDNMYGDLIFSSINKNYNLYSLKKNESGNSQIINFPKNIYLYEDVIDQRIRESLMSLVNSENVFVREKLHGINKLKKIEKLTEDSEYEDHKRSSILIVDELNVGLLSFEESDKNMYISNVYDYIFDKKNSKVFQENISSDSLIEINQKIYNIKDVDYIPIDTESSKIKLYTKSLDNILESSFDIYKNWKKGDCNAHDGNREVFFNFDVEKNSLVLKSQNNHNACTYSNIDIEKNEIYSLVFDYETNNDRITVFIELSDGEFIKREEKVNQKGQFNLTFKNPIDDDIKLYLYSGESSDKSITEYFNVRLFKYNFLKEFDDTDIAIDNLHSRYIPGNSLSKRMKIISPVVNNVDEFSNSFENWKKGDCGAINLEKKVFFNNISNNEIELKSSDGHNACMHKSISIDKNYKYDLSFQYMNKDLDYIDIYIDYGKNNNPQKIRKSVQIGQWEDLSFEIYPPRDAEKMTIYFYSGKSQNSNYTRSVYKNIKLSYSLRGYYNNLLVENDGDISEIKPEVSFKKEANYQYRVFISSITRPELLNFVDSYHPKWNIFAIGTDGKKVGINAQHVEVNRYSNGWVINPKEICENNKNFCVKNEDGSYDMEMTIEFVPQRWFYLGLFISGITFMSLIGFLGYDFVRRRRVKRYGLQRGDVGGEKRFGGSGSRSRRCSTRGVRR
ncbi:MAG: hypothetical protein CR972_02335 [Candidatus Moraniibacteriota bacterium]|nr:MAG: hypothetical protein CR972_02335 [Candidatus Moranbacteria bacterium]